MGTFEFFLSKLILHFMKDVDRGQCWDAVRLGSRRGKTYIFRPFFECWCPAHLFSARCSLLSAGAYARFVMRSFLPNIVVFFALLVLFLCWCTGYLQAAHVAYVCGLFPRPNAAQVYLTYME